VWDRGGKHSKARTIATTNNTGIPRKNSGIPKIGDKKKRPSSQIPFFTYKPLAECGFEARQIRVIRTHPNSPESPNLVIRLFGSPE
jgi:hypothetical protein